MLAWQLARAALQGVWAIGVARLLGPGEYGLFAGFAGLATTLGALTGLGFGLLMLQTTARDPRLFPAYWSKAMAAVLGSGLVLLLVYALVAQALAGHPARVDMLLAIAVPELICFPICIISSYAFQAHDRMGWAGAMYALVPVGNMVALALYGWLGIHGALPDYLRWHVWAAVASAVLAIVAVSTKLRPAARLPRLAPGDTANAASYTSMRVVDTGLAAIDKTIMLRVAGAELAGQYTAAYRLAALIALPVVSLAISATPRLFRATSTPGEHARLARRLLAWGLVIGAVSIPATWCVSYLLPWLFGAAFTSAAELARLLAPLPALLGLATLGCAILMAEDRRGLRTAIQAGAIGLLLLLMPWLVNASGGLGAAIALQATYAGLTLAVWWPLLRARPALPMSAP